MFCGYNFVELFARCCLGGINSSQNIDERDNDISFSGDTDDGCCKALVKAVKNCCGQKTNYDSEKLTMDADWFNFVSNNEQLSINSSEKSRVQLQSLSVQKPETSLIKYVSNVVPWHLFSLDVIFFIAAMIIERVLHNKLRSASMLTKYDTYGPMDSLSRARSENGCPREHNGYIKKDAVYRELIKVLDGCLRQQAGRIANVFGVSGAAYVVYLVLKLALIAKDYAASRSRKWKKDSWKLLRSNELIEYNFPKDEVKKLTRWFNIFQNTSDKRLVLEPNNYHKIMNCVFDLLFKMPAYLSSLLCMRVLHNQFFKVSPDRICVEQTSVGGRNIVFFKNEPPGPAEGPHAEYTYYYGKHGKQVFPMNPSSLMYHAQDVILDICTMQVINIIMNQEEANWLLLIPILTMMLVQGIDLVKRSFFNKLQDRCQEIFASQKFPSSSSNEELLVLEDDSVDEEEYFQEMNQ